jgi:hypothetical protein
VLIKNNNENLGKYDDRADEGILLGYSTNSKGYIYASIKDCVN